MATNENEDDTPAEMKTTPVLKFETIDDERNRDDFPEFRLPARRKPFRIMTVKKTDDGKYSCVLQFEGTAWEKEIPLRELRNYDPELAVMPDSCAFRARSRVCLPRSRSVDRLGTVGTLSRVTSVPNLASLHVGADRYRTGTLHKYRTNYDSMDNWEHDRYTFYQPYYWPTYRYAARRELYTDPIPNSLAMEAPNFWPRYKWYSDWLNPTYWRRHRDPNYDRPLWNKWQPWQMDRYNVKQAVKMYRNGTIDFATLDKKWIEPTALGRRGKDWSDVYTPAARYGAHRYFYSWK